MFGSKIISVSKNVISYIYKFVISLPNTCVVKFNEWKAFLTDFKYKLYHLKETNYNLGFFHLQRQNLNDSIIRLKLVEKFFNPKDSKASYLLGWCYFLKNNIEKAIYYLNNANTEDTSGLGVFLKDYTKYNEIPEDICLNYRNFTAEKYTTKFHSDSIHLPYNFIQQTLSNITTLPDHYSILELGANVGLVGYEVEKRFPDKYTMVGVENAEKMIELINFYYPNYSIYDSLICSSIRNFLNETKDKFDIVISFCGLTFTNDLISYLHLIYRVLNNDGVFACCLPTTDTKTELSLKRNEFVYNAQEVKDLICKSNIFTLAHYSEMILSLNNQYSVFVCMKMK